MLYLPPMHAQRVMSLSDWITLVGLSVLWGGSYFFFKMLIAELPALTIVLTRVGAAALILLVILYLTRGSLPSSPRIWVAFGVMGIFNNVVPFGLIIWGESQISSGLASILVATTPLFSVLLAHVLTKNERLTPNRVAGVCIGLAGVAVLMGPNALAGLNLTSLAQLAMIGAAISYAWSAIFGQEFTALGVAPLTVATGQTIGAAVVSLPLALLVDRPWTLAHAPSVTAWCALGGLVVLSTVVAYILYFRLLASAAATNSLLVTFLIPVSALLLGSLILKERLSALDLIGMLLIFAGLAAIDGRLLRALRLPLTRARVDG